MGKTLSSSLGKMWLVGIIILVEFCVNCGGNHVIKMSGRQRISGSEEYHYEIWKQSRINLVEEEVQRKEVGKNFESNEQLPKMGEVKIPSFQKVPDISNLEQKLPQVPQYMIDLFYKNMQNNNSVRIWSDSDSTTKAKVQSDSEKENVVIRSFDVNMIVNSQDSTVPTNSQPGCSTLSFNITYSPGEILHRAELHLNISESTLKLQSHQRIRVISPLKLPSRDIKSYEDFEITEGIFNLGQDSVIDITSVALYWGPLEKQYLEGKELKIITKTEIIKIYSELHYLEISSAFILLYSNSVEEEIGNQIELAEMIHYELDNLQKFQKLAGSENSFTTRVKRSSSSNNVINNEVVSRGGEDYEDMEEFRNEVTRNLIISNTIGLHSSSKNSMNSKNLNAHLRRHLVKKMWGPCRKRPFFVNFTEVKFDSWIIAPKGYQAYECYGRCGYPLGAHLTPTKHAILRAMLNGISPKKATRACCVPTKLEPISLLYLDDNGVVTYKYNYDDMIVAECGCR